MSEERITVGLDMSLTASGICIKQGSKITVETIKTTPATADNDLSRLKYIVGQVMQRIPLDTKMICIEDFFTPANAFQIGSAIKLAMLGTAIRLALYDAKFPFYVIAPSSLKKHILGKGVGQKSLIIREVFKKYGENVKDDNQADAIVLATIAEHLFATLKGETIDITKPQSEVIKNLIAAKDERSYHLP